ncbi:carboxylesterase family protein [Colletotrichum camelliae]|nr:carboxylesterase family protein [Colletotrichum camelliae]
MKFFGFFALSLASVPLCSGAPSFERGEDAASTFLSGLIASTQAIEKRFPNASCQQNALAVDLGGKVILCNEVELQLTIFSIRYAAPPTGALRWQPPQPPSPEISNGTTPATEFGHFCPQNYPAVPGAPFSPGFEDCLFLNVYAPAGAKDLPVMVWIHGGGYGFGDGRQDMSEILNANENGFVVVSIQYRLGAFGFLSSADIKSRGAVNAGLLDQALALAWVQKYACKFGGDRKRITITGESAGAGSVMYHALAADGSLGSLFFTNGIAASPYLPFQYGFDADFPTQRYQSFAEKAGCSSEADVLECLRGKDSMILQEASANTTAEQTYGRWAFSPVTDGVYIKSLASEQLTQKKVNGERLLNNANEGPLFVPPNIASNSDLTAWLKLSFPNLSGAQIDDIVAKNPTKTGTNDTRFETNGLTGLTALDISQAGAGPLQQAINIYAEQTFVCPSYWLSSAFTGSKSAWHYQYSVPFAWHTSDVPAYFGPATPNQGSEFVLAFRKIWGNFVMKNDPSISNEEANGASSADSAAKYGASEWPVWTETEPKQLNLNQTGGVPYQFTTQWGVTVTQFQAPGQVNAIAVVPADSWEGGRGARCDFWKTLAPSIPA